MTEQIAIIGMGCRFPGDADSPDELWQLLIDGRDAVGPVPPARAESGAFGPRTGGYLADIAGFDAGFFGISGREADALDPQHRLLLEVSWQALEHAGLPPEQLAGTDTGVFTGLSYNEYLQRFGAEADQQSSSVLVNGHCVAPGRLSYLLGLHGPSMALDTACSSSLVALHLACQSLRDGDCDLALAGGVTVMLSTSTTSSFERMNMLSGTGRCHTFDEAADGFVRGEGCGVVVLKRLADAVADGDRVLAVIRGSAVNQDGASDGLAAPSRPAQAALYRRALAAAGLKAEDISLVETHGTGTPVGDPVEFGSLSEVYGAGDRPCALGSIKTNLGHLEPAAGISGLIKAVLCLQHAAIPANLHFTSWNPAIPDDHGRLFVPAGPTGWPEQAGPRRAAVSSFGFSGTNAHVILEQAPEGPAEPSRVVAGPRLFLVPAASTRVLPQAATDLADWLDGTGGELDDIAHTLALRRSPGRGRLAVVASSRQELSDELRAFAAGEARPAATSGWVGSGVRRPAVWVFSGQGSQWAGMGRGLLEHEPAFAAALAEVEDLIQREAGFSVGRIIRDGLPVAGPGQVQPVLFAMQLALAASWRAHGVEPAGVIGHSMGEVAAAVVAGALSLADGVRVICRRSALLATIAGHGAMAAVALDRASVEAELTAARVNSAVSLAVLAGPSSTVVAGAVDQVETLVSQWERRGISAHPIAVDVASHSPQVDPLLDPLRAALAELTPATPGVRFYSTVLRDPRQPPDFDAEYWCANLRQPVRFDSALAAAAADRHAVYLEISPHPVVTRAIGSSLTGLLDSPTVLPTLRRDCDDLATFRLQLGAAHCAGVPVDWSSSHRGGLVDLPTMTFDRTPHWLEVDGQSSSVAATPGPASAGWPGRRFQAPGSDTQHWQAETGTAALPWLAEHRVHDEAVLPGAAYAAIAVGAGAELFGVPANQVRVTGLDFQQLFRLSERAELVTTVSAGHCTFHSRVEDGDWVVQASAGLSVEPAGPAGEPEPEFPSRLLAEHPEPGSAAELYAGLRRRGVLHETAFQVLSELRRSADGRSSWARVAVPAGLAGIGSPPVHPILLDACAQLLAGHVPAGQDGLILPMGIGELRLLSELPEPTGYCHARVTEQLPDGLVGEVTVYSEAGRPAVRLTGVRLRCRAAGSDRLGGSLLQPDWQLSARLATAGRHADRWLLIGDSDQAGRLAGHLSATGAQTDLLSLDDDSLDRARQSVLDSLDSSGRPERICHLADRQAPAGSITDCRRLLAVLQAVLERCPEPPRLYLLTTGAESLSDTELPDPAQAALRGVLRVAAFENPELRMTKIDLAGTAEDDLAGAAVELIGDFDDDEVALRAGGRYVARLGYAPVTEQEHDAATMRQVDVETEGFRLTAGRLGDLGSLEPTAAPRSDPGPGQVELRVDTAGVNFRDVLTALGMLGDAAGTGSRIGFECTGIVTASRNEAVPVGQRVLAIDFRGGAFGSYLTVPAGQVRPIPDGVDPAAMAGVPAVFLTAWYALRRLARLTAGERVLIHSGTGGTGLAAIAVARSLGAEVFATAGSPAKRDYLRGLGIAHVMDSRSLDFADQTLAATGGEGVDVVLNSLSGQAIRAGLRTLRPFGRFIELGVRDILADAPLGMLALEHNITLSSVNLIELQQRRPELFGRLFDELLAEFAAGRLAALPSRTFELSDATEAFRLMAGAGHLGKLLLRVPAAGRLPVRVTDSSPVRQGGAYLISGGLGGVGLATASWLAGRGAGHLVLNGRSRPTRAAEAELDRLRAAGTRVTVLLGDIGSPGVAERMVAAAGPQLAGVVHSAMSLQDAAIPNVTDDQLRQVWHPKVAGALALHEAVAGLELDWFVLYSSLASLVGNPGQAAYAAANAWLDAFASWRNGQRQRTLAVNWSAWGEVGRATDFADRGYRTIATVDGFAALESLLRHGRVRTGVIPGDPESWLPPSGRGSSFFAGLRPAPGSRPAGDDTADIRRRILAAPAGAARIALLEGYLSDEVRAVLRLGEARIDPQTPLRSLGFDSLLSMELRTRLQNGLGVRLANNFVWTHETLAALATGLTAHLETADAA